MRDMMDFIELVYSKLPETVRNTAMIGGGALRTFFDGTQIKDIDLFFRSEWDFLAAKRALAMHEDWLLSSDEQLLAGCPVFHLPGLPPVNLVGFRFADTPRLLAYTFDLRCCAMAARCADGLVEFYAVPGAIEDAEAKALTVLNLQAFDRVKKRVLRYVGYGYRASPTLRSSLFKSRRLRGTNTNY